MKKLVLLTISLTVFLSACKKNDLTPGGKPLSDIANNMVRVDVASNADYSISIQKYNYPNTDGQAVLYSNQSQSASKPFEFAYKATTGNALLVEVESANGTMTHVDIYYKGEKVPASLESIDELQGESPSHINLTYVIGAQ